MNTLLSIRANILYSKKDKIKKEDIDEFVKYYEIIFLVDKPKYKHTNSSEIIRERTVDEHRFTVSEKALDSMIEHLIKFKDINESELS
jgi:hypothetical protein